MRRINLLFSLSSLSVLLVTIERFSFTTKVLLPPFDFLRLHEMVQMTVLILMTVVIPFLLFKEVTDNFTALKTKRGFQLVLLFVVGVYFYATGNGLHEVASFTFNQYCDVKNFTDNLCGGLFFNDYYTGNIFYFIGGAMMVTALMLAEKMRSGELFKKNDLIILFINAVIYAFAIFAYAAFDRVLVGLVYSITLSLISLGILVSVRKKYANYPVITYTAATYTLATVAALLVRLHSGVR